ncbi:MAG: NAD kinase [Burkholderiaceae bacterium]
MKSPFECVALIGRHQTPGVAETVGQIAAFLRDRGHRVLIDSSTAGSIELPGVEEADSAQIASQASLGIAIGGDGTMLGFARQLAAAEVPLVGINHGRLGFITDISLQSWRDALAAILEGHYDAEDRSLLLARASRDGEEVWRDLALNDVVVNRSSRSGMIELEVNVDGVYMYTQRADGLIVATPTGSTAYALSANGPILHPRLAGLVMVPVAPHSLSNRPIALPDDVEIRIRVVDGREPRVGCDMQVFTDLQSGDDIIVQRAPFTIRFLHPVGYSYFATLRSKLYWHEFPIIQPRP